LRTNIVPTNKHIKFDERNHLKKSLLSHVCRLGWGIIALMQDLLTGKMRVTPLFEDRTP